MIEHNYCKAKHVIKKHFNFLKLHSIAININYKTFLKLCFFNHRLYFITVLFNHYIMKSNDNDFRFFFYFSIYNHNILINIYRQSIQTFKYIIFEM